MPTITDSKIAAQFETLNHLMDIGADIETISQATNALCDMIQDRPSSFYLASADAGKAY